MLLASLFSSHPTFCHFPHFPHMDCALSSADSQVGGFVYVLGPVGLSSGLFCEIGSFSCHCTPPLVFTATGFKALFSHFGALGCTVCLTPQLFLPTYPHKCGTTQSSGQHLVTTSQPWLPFSSPSASLDECFFFTLLVVGLPYSLNFWQFWLFFV